mgnify:CR=1 FL=1
MRRKYPKICVRDFGPFQEADIELKPLTLIIGRNSVGKSILAYLIWSLAITMPDPKRLGREAEKKGAENLARKILDEIRKGKNPKHSLRKFIKIYIEALPEALAVDFGETLQRVFMAKPGELVRTGADRATITVESPNASVEFTIKNHHTTATSSRHYLEYLDELETTILRSNILRVSFAGEEIFESQVASLHDVASILLLILVDYLYEAYSPFFTSEKLAALLADSRAGISRTLLKPYLSPKEISEISYPDGYFVRLYYRLAEKLAEGVINLDPLKPLLKELGCEIEHAYEGGAYTVYVKTWTGKRLPLPRAPSGIRESLTVALALASPAAPHLVIIEEPEAHLHPRAQLALARLVVKAVNELRKTVVITTHSDYFVYRLSNMIALSQISQKAKELGFTETEALAPHVVAAYLARPEDRKAILTPLQVTSEGIPEEEFAEVAEELASERARILA